MTQSKPKPKLVPKRVAPYDQIYKSLDRCSDEELKKLAAEIEQLLWERQMVAKAVSTPGENVDGFVFLEELRQKAEARMEKSQT